MPLAQDLLSHVPIALIVMLAAWALGRRLGAGNRAAAWTGWFAGACTCFVREVTQQEYRWIEQFGQGRRANMPMLEGLRIWDWSLHSQVQTLGALVLSALVAFALARRG